MDDKRKYTGIGKTCGECGKSWAGDTDCKNARTSLLIRHPVED